ncbi:hypothetical protein GCM10027341_07960 [Spirosoma knui]
MKGVLVMLAQVGFWGLLGCAPDEVLPDTFTNQAAEIELVSCSRGCEQYILNTETVVFHVENMPDSLKIRAVPEAYVNNRLSVVVSGRRLDEQVQVYTPGPGDKPEPAYKAYKLQLTAIRRR